MNLLLDTNVVIDFLGKQPLFFDDTAQVIAAGFFGDAKLWASAQSFKDAFYVLSHYADSMRVQQAMLSLLELVNPVDLTGEDVISAARLQWPDFEDCLVAVCARKIRADYLITRDIKGFEKSLAPVLSPSEWLEHMREQGRLTFAPVEL